MVAKAKKSSERSVGNAGTAGNAGNPGKGVTVVQKRVYRTPNTTRLEVLVKKIGEAPHDKKFVLKDGRPLKDFVELAHALEHMSDDVFNHHVNNFKNDFRAWIQDVFGEKELAAELAKIKTRGEMQLAVLKHIVKKTFS